MSTRVHLVVPSGVDDTHRPSGGNIYDRRLAVELGRRGWLVMEHQLGHTATLVAALTSIADGAPVVIDGLVGSAQPEVLAPAARRLRLILLIHQPHDTPAEREAVQLAEALVVTSNWTRRWLIGRYGLSPNRIFVAEPGVDPAALAIGTADGVRLLCVAAVAAHKGQDVLVNALAGLTALPWKCTCVGALDRDVEFVRQLREQLESSGLAERVMLVGPRSGDDLAADYAGADVLVLPSLAETYGMVVTEALAHGVPVIASDIGGISEALGTAPDGHRPGLLVPAGSPAGLSTALRRWLTDPRARAGLRRAARLRRQSLPRWSQTARCVEDALTACPTVRVGDAAAAGEPSGAADRMHPRQTSRR